MIAFISRLITSTEHQRLILALDWLYRFVVPHRQRIMWLMLLSVVGSFFALLQPWLTKLIIDDALLAGNFQKLVWIALAIILIGVLGTALSGLNRFLYTSLSGTILFALRLDIYQHLQKLSPCFYSQWRMGDLLNRLDGDVAEIQRFAVDSLFAAVSNILGLLGALVLLISLSWELALIVFVLIPVDILWLHWMRKKVEQHSRDLREKSSDISSFMVETVPAMKFVQASVREPYEASRLARLSDKYLQQLLRLQVTEFFTHALPGTLMSITRAAAFIIGGYWVIHGAWQLGALIAFSTYLGMVIGPAQSLLSLYVSVQRMSVSLLRVQELRAVPAHYVVNEVAARSLPVNIKGAISLENVSFRHPDRATHVLSNTYACFPAGHKIYITGASGSGKSTLIDLIQRFYTPDAGRILLDGVDLGLYSVTEWRRRVAVVSQDVIFFRGSLAENMRYVAPDATDEQIVKALNEAQLSELITDLPHGINSTLAERALQLSGGQKQRLAIARALLQNPVLVIFDEATSAVDEETEEAIMQVVDELFSHCTRIIINHRSHTWQHADECWLLEGGALRQIGVR